MAAKNKTALLNLPLWEANEYPQRTDFVDANKTIENEYKKMVFGDLANYAAVHALTYTAKKLSNGWKETAGKFTKTSTKNGTTWNVALTYDGEDVAIVQWVKLSDGSWQEVFNLL